MVSDLLGGAKSILVGNLIQNQFAVARNKPFGSAIAFELTAVVLLLLLRLRDLHAAQGPGGPAVSAGHAARGPELAASARSRRLARRRSARARTVRLGALPARRAQPRLVYLFLYVPIAILVALLASTARKQTAVWEGFTLDWYAALLEQRA